MTTYSGKLKTIHDLLMITDKEYEAIGRLALSFNEIESVLDNFSAALIGAREWKVSELLGNYRGDFGRKVDRFKGIVEAIAAERSVGAPSAHSILDLLKKAKMLAEQRNKYIHAVVVVDPKSKHSHQGAGTKISHSTKSK